MGKNKRYDKIVVYAIPCRGDDVPMHIGSYYPEELPDIRCWLFDKDTIISFEIESKQDE